MAMWKETPTGRREKPGAQKKHVKRPPEEPEDVGVTADRSGEKSIGGSKWGEVKHREEGGGDRGSTAARPTLTRNWGKKIKPEPETGGDLRSETQCR